MTRVLVETPPFPLDVVRELLGPTGANVEPANRPWEGGDIEALLAWSAISDADMSRLPALKVIATCSVGFDHVDTAAAERRGIWVCNVPDYCVDEMADSTIALLLALVRGVVVLDRDVREGGWDDHAAGPLLRAADVRLGVIGFGRIGRAVASRALVLGMEVWAHDVAVSPSVLAAAGVHSGRLEDVLRSCNAITIHVPLTRRTRGMFGARELALLPRGAFMINTARAGLIDDAALLAALDSGSLGGAALDVLSVEPPTPESPAPRHRRLIVTPHSAWYSPLSETEVYRRAVLSVLDVLEGREPGGVVVSPRRSRARLKGDQKSEPRT
ncbi:MAG TPA: C-terminal binding protein [Candidatus Dormibacteraeota bacterium]|nr:C-terminal binding protein [Candidatus Dormibacteraeota bacterium]